MHIFTYIYIHDGFSPFFKPPPFAPPQQVLGKAGRLKSLSKVSFAAGFCSGATEVSNGAEEMGKILGLPKLGFEKNSPPENWIEFLKHPKSHGTFGKSVSSFNYLLVSNRYFFPSFFLVCNFFRESKGVRLESWQV